LYARWVNKNVDFKVLMSEITAFFERKGFKVKEHYEREKERYSIIVKIYGYSKVIKIILEGTPQNFIVEGTFVGGQPRYGFTSMFGGGIFLLRELKLRERLLNLEKEFSSYLDNIVIRLVNSSASDEIT